jgi:stage III sporulation protein SpoIIIAA
MSLHTDGLSQFLDVLPSIVRDRLERAGGLDSLIEVVLDYGRPAEARYRDRVERYQDVVVSEHDIDYVSKSIGEFGSDNRAGIERTLHRISAIRNRHNKIIGLTCRVGRALEGTIDMIDDIVRSGQSILLLGRPGVGKTTKLREVARVLADEVAKRVVIVDTSNEIAGDGDVPHPGIGAARRMQVRIAAEQHNVMIEAVENHMPEVIVIDEIGTEAEAGASRTIAERGVQLVGTAHGQTLENLMLNPTLADLIGGIQAVTLSDAEAQRRGTQKTVLERKAPPTFDVVIELLDYDRLAVHHNVQKTVDMILRGVPPRPEIRVRTGAGEMEIVQSEQTADLNEPGFNKRFPALARSGGERQEKVSNGSPARTSPTINPPNPQSAIPNPKSEEGVVDESGNALIRIFPYGIARTRLERAIREKRAPAFVTNDINQADAIMAIRSTYQSRPKKLRDVVGRPVNTVVVKSNTFSQIATALDDIVRQASEGPGAESEAMEEVQSGIETVLQTGKPFELSPAPAPVRKVQHQMAEARRLASESVGEEPNRRLRLLPTRI